MNRTDIVEREAHRRDLPPFRPGDTVRVHVNIREGDKERIQVFEGVVIRRRGAGASATFTVRKLSYGVGVERIFPVESPIVKQVEIKSRGHVRRSRLYFLRELRGKKARLRSKLRDLSALISEEEAEALARGEDPESALAAEPAPVDAEGETGPTAEPVAEEASPAEAAEEGDEKTTGS